MLSAQQIEIRKQGIGGSEAAAVLGVNPFTTPFDIWLEKTGRKQPKDISNQPMIYWGHLLEEVIAKEYERRSNCQVVQVPETLWHPQHSWMLAHIDRKIVNEPKLLECKTARSNNAKYWGRSGSDWIPEPYLVQVQHYLAVTDFIAADVAVLIGGYDFRIYSIKRDEVFIEMLIKRLSDFWHNHVLADLPPVSSTSSGSRTPELAIQQAFNF